MNELVPNLNLLMFLSLLVLVVVVHSGREKNSEGTNDRRDSVSLQFTESVCGAVVRLALRGEPSKRGGAAFRPVCLAGERK